MFKKLPEGEACDLVSTIPGESVMLCPASAPTRMIVMISIWLLHVLVGQIHLDIPAPFAVAILVGFGLIGGLRHGCRLTLVIYSPLGVIRGLLPVITRTV
ncbi:hypothetical protein [Sphaerimonospora thailandensis]|uniref:Uncharacterized protein n=1 Tax=Sphaerimonospora thailandensis TaxID=795644 RepID=A0A8J3W323_9ACTN|nr:hypothetical protein [Sphaerimonospora thailandensis]GIH73396.1 hypothetical protein Mth01_56490 [Sphaerimonospora thailandensis]